MSRNVLKNKRGVTLIEVIVSLALVALVTLMVFSFMNYGGVAFSQGRDQNSAQADLRLVHDYIATNLRFATSIDLLSALPGTLEAGFDYLYFNGVGLSHSIYSAGSRTTRSFGSSLLSSSHFSGTPGDTVQLIGIHLFATERNRSYDLSTAIELPNIALNGGFLDEQSLSAGAIKFSRDFVLSTPGDPSEMEYWTITTSPEPTEGGYSPPISLIPKGYMATLTAEPNYGYNFKHWRDETTNVVVSTLNPHSFEPVGDTDLVAVFEVDPHASPPSVTVTVLINVTVSNTREYVVQLGITSITRTVSTNGLQEFVFSNIDGYQVYQLTITRQRHNASTPTTIHTDAIGVLAEDKVAVELSDGN